MTNPLFEIGTVIIIATIIAYTARLIKQPMILGYIIAGFIIGPAAAGLITSTETILLLSELGIAFVLFVVGLELDFNLIKQSGMRTVLLGAGQVAVTGAAGFALARVFGFDMLPAFYIAAALTFSSTMVTIKLLSDKNTLDTTYGRLVLGILLLQDVVAIFILALLPNLGQNMGSIVIGAITSGFILFAITIIATKVIIPVVFRYAAHSTELLLLTALSWLFMFAFLAEYLHYSVAIGAFLAGISLASSSYKLEVASRVKVLRDFFATIFFVSLDPCQTILDDRA